MPESGNNKYRASRITLKPRNRYKTGKLILLAGLLVMFIKGKNKRFKPKA